MRKTAFSLIELISVVAIIAILAAIAVPNFLEAQVRSKIARVRADLRTLATGLEGYAADNNRYIDSNALLTPPFATFGISPKFADPNYPANTLPLLTTPVAYLSEAILEDPFDVGTTPPFFYGYVNTKIASAQDLTTLGFAPGDADLQAHDVQEHNYMITSLGPDSYSYVKNPDAKGDQGILNALSYLARPASGVGSNMLYDPSNGTVSQGELVRTAKGMLN
ncbi:MAG: prepilin-type N-terminal cleavage/methylation domain-containing protein [Sumerlaeia bacterium]